MPLLVFIEEAAKPPFLEFAFHHRNYGVKPCTSPDEFGHSSCPSGSGEVRQAFATSCSNFAEQCLRRHRRMMKQAFHAIETIDRTGFKRHD
jgi:hypothetical protein